MPLTGSKQSERGFAAGTRALRAVVSSLVIVAIGLTTPASALAAVRIVKIQYESPGPDTGTNKSLNAEYVVIKNTGSKRVRLTGFKLVDKRSTLEGGDVVFRFPRFRLRPGRTVTVHTGKGSRTRTDLYWGRSTYTWGDDADSAYFYNRAGRLIDRCHYVSTTVQTSPPAYC